MTDNLSTVTVQIICMHLFLILVVIWVVFSKVQNIRITKLDLALEVGP